MAVDRQTMEYGDDHLSAVIDLRLQIDAWEKAGKM
jgi:hypothetical protein